MAAGTPLRTRLLHTGAAIGAEFDMFVDKINFGGSHAGVLCGF